MNINPIILSALKPIGLPVFQDILKKENKEHGVGSINEYITFNYADERPVIYADDTDIADMTTVQVHYFTKGDPTKIKKAIRSALRSADFCMLETADFFEEETGFKHIIVSASIGGLIDDE